LDGYCERHHQRYDVNCINGQWVWECAKCRNEGLLDIFYDNKTTVKLQQDWAINNQFILEEKRDDQC